MIYLKFFRNVSLFLIIHSLLAGIYLIFRVYNIINLGIIRVDVFTEQMWLILVYILIILGFLLIALVVRFQVSCRIIASGYIFIGLSLIVGTIYYLIRDIQFIIILRIPHQIQIFLIGGVILNGLGIIWALVEFSEHDKKESKILSIIRSIGLFFPILLLLLSLFMFDVNIIVGIINSIVCRRGCRAG